MTDIGRFFAFLLESKLGNVSQEVSDGQMKGVGKEQSLIKLY